ncbi:hypothetical protein V8B97DRAFT_2026722 [Scleroderma yunnanense]
MNNETTKYHSCSCQPTLFQKFEEFSIKNKTLCTSAVDSTPWKPLKTQGNHHFAEIALDAGLNKVQVDDLLTLFTLISQGKEQVTITTNAELQKFSKHVVSAPYKGKSMEFECFYNEPWTCDCWWDIQVSDLEKEGKLGYTTLKCVVWHESTLKLFEVIIHFSKASFEHHFYNIHKAAGDEILKKLRLHPILNVFWLIRYSDPYLALSFDFLHSLHLGLWGKHLFEDLKIILRYLRCGAEGTVEGLVKGFPHWHKLSHFKAILKVSFSNGNKLADLSIQVFYAALNVLTHAACPSGHLLVSLISSCLQLNSLIGLNVHTGHMVSAIEAELLVFNERLQAAKKSSIPGLKVDWDFPKMHLWRHVIHDIWEKGMHGPLKEAYQDHSNKRDVASQVNYYDKWHQSRNGEHSNNDNDNDDLPLEFEGHFKLGSSCKPSTIQEIKMAHDTKDKAYFGF